AFVKLKAVSSEWLAPDEYTFAAVVAAAASLPAMCSGKPLHACVIKAGLESSVFDPESAHILFDSVMVKDVIMWTEMVAGHSALGEGELSLKYFIGMLEVGHKADNFSLS
ncbi:hypothetical protein ACJX0J_041419, partial [Zea mays]